MTYAAQNAVWITQVLRESKLCKRTKLIPLLSDNQAANAWAVSGKCPSSRDKHIDLRVYFIRELVQSKAVDLAYVPTEGNNADMLTMLKRSAGM